ncbi:MAG TPA: cytochrome P450 [Kineosporiaceae bacterium]|nr:cytochrome P450 [Kineosporiaceae bacterium]
MTTRAIPEPTPGPTTGAATGVAVPAPGRRLPSQRGLLLDLDALPERLAAIVTAGEGVIQQRGLVRTAVVCDPALSRELLSRPTGTSQGKGIAALRLTLGQGLLTSDGALHRRQRRLVQPAFHSRRLTRYAVDAVRAARERSSTWHDGQRLDLASEMSSLTLDVVGRTIFGADVRDHARDVSLAQTQLLECFPRLLRPTGLVAARLPTRLGRRVRRSVALLDRRSNTSWLTGAGTATPVT